MFQKHSKNVCFWPSVVCFKFLLFGYFGTYCIRYTTTVSYSEIKIIRMDRAVTLCALKQPIVCQG